MYELKRVTVSQAGFPANNVNDTITFEVKDGEDS